MKFNRKKMLVLFGLAVAVTLVASQAMALTAPVAGSFGYEAYDFFINKLVKGPFGAIASVLLILTSIIFFVKQTLAPAITCILAGVLLINASAIVTSLGGIM